MTTPGTTGGRQPPALRLGWDQVVAWRLRRHHLAARAPRRRALEVAAAICGLHAQVMSSAELTLWARVEDLEPDAVRRALWEERTLVKTWAMRGTLHLLPAAELPLWQAALRTRDRYFRPVWLRNFGVTGQELERLIEAVDQALDGRVLTREELAREVGRLTGSAALGDKVRHSWGALLKPAAHYGRLCFGPSDGQRVRFTRLDRWLPDWREHDPDSAVLETARRFLAASGPVTREDYARWWGVESPAGGRTLARLGDELVPVEVDGTPAWLLAAHAGEVALAAPPAGAAAVRLLPAFDQYVVTASRHADRLLPGPFRDRVYRPQGWLSPVLLVNGRMDGVWRHEVKGRGVHVSIEPFVELSAATRRAAEREAERLAAALGGPLQLTWVASR
jgi:Winged helix DNA-binding domain